MGANDYSSEELLDGKFLRFSDREVGACWQKFLGDIERPAHIDLQNRDTVLKVWRHRVSKSGHKTAARCLGGSQNFLELDQLSDGLAHYLLTRPYLQGGDRVAIMLPNLTQYMVSILGILKAGMVVVNCNPLYTKPEIEHQLSDAGAKVLITLANLAKTPSEAVVSSLKEVIVTELGDLLIYPKRILTNFVVRHVKRMIPFYSFAQPIIVSPFIQSCAPPSQEQQAKLRHIEQTMKPQDIAFIQYTGGTTGVSKGALLSHLNIVANMHQSDAAFTQDWCQRLEQKLKLPGHSNLVCLLPLPFYHIYSLTCGFFACTVHKGATSLTLPNTRDFPAFIKLMSHPDITFIGMINTLLKAVLLRPEFAKVNLRSSVGIVSGGMPTSADVRQAWEERTQTKITEGYGLTEASPLLAVTDSRNPRSGVAGYAVADTLIKLRDSEGHDILPGEGPSKRGELLAKGPQVMLGYHNNPGETAHIFSDDGYLMTGDIAIIQPDGLIEIVDRKKDMILVSGFNVYPNEIDATAMATGMLIECAAFGLPDEKTGEKVVLYAVPNNKTITTQELSSALAASLTNYKRPSKIVFVASLPKTPVGKILRRELRKIAHESEK